LFNNSVASLTLLKPTDIKKILANKTKGEKVSKEGRIILLVKTVRLINVKEPNLSKLCSSLLQAEAYAKKNIEGSADRATMRKYLKSQSFFVTKEID
jgi:hypothetical protein